MDEMELLKIRIDYAWKYFESAAKQRMLFFNYFLIIVGILGSAIGFAVKECMYPVALPAAIIGFVSSVAFIFFDVRMLVFVERASLVLDALERQWLFPDGFKGQSPSGASTEQLGLARIEPDRQAAGKVDWKSGANVTKVKRWIRLVEWLTAVGFLLAIVWIIFLWGTHKVPTKTTTTTTTMTTTTTSTTSMTTQPQTIVGAPSLDKSEPPRPVSSVQQDNVGVPLRH